MLGEQGPAKRTGAAESSHEEDPPVSGEATVEVAQVLARLKVAEELAAGEDPAAVPGLARAQALIRELAGWPVEDDSRIT
jgi:hypothetical protein